MARIIIVGLFMFTFSILKVFAQERCVPVTDVYALDGFAVGALEEITKFVAEGVITDSVIAAVALEQVPLIIAYPPYALVAALSSVVAGFAVTKQFDTYFTQDLNKINSLYVNTFGIDKEHFEAGKNLAELIYDIVKFRNVAVELMKKLPSELVKLAKVSKIKPTSFNAAILTRISQHALKDIINQIKELAINAKDGIESACKQCCGHCEDNAITKVLCNEQHKPPPMLPKRKPPPSPKQKTFPLPTVQHIEPFQYGDPAKCDLPPEFAGCIDQNCGSLACCIVPPACKGDQPCTSKDCKICPSNC